MKTYQNPQPHAVERVNKKNNKTDGLKEKEKNDKPDLKKSDEK